MTESSRQDNSFAKKVDWTGDKPGRGQREYVIVTSNTTASDSDEK